MSFDPIRNFAESYLVSGITSTEVEITIPFDHINRFPNPNLEGEFNLVIYNARDYINAGKAVQAGDGEIVRTKSISGNKYTIERAQENTVAVDLNTQDVTYTVEQSLTAKTIKDIKDYVNFNRDNHTLLELAEDIEAGERIKIQDNKVFKLKGNRILESAFCELDNDISGNVLTRLLTNNLFFTISLDTNICGFLLYENESLVLYKLGNIFNKTFTSFDTFIIDENAGHFGLFATDGNAIWVYEFTIIDNVFNLIYSSTNSFYSLDNTGALFTKVIVLNGFIYLGCGMVILKLNRNGVGVFNIILSQVMRGRYFNTQIGQLIDFDVNDFGEIVFASYKTTDTGETSTCVDILDEDFRFYQTGFLDGPDWKQNGCYSVIWLNNEYLVIYANKSHIAKFHKNEISKEFITSNENMLSHTTTIFYNNTLTPIQKLDNNSCLVLIHNSILFIYFNKSNLPETHFVTMTPHPSDPYVNTTYLQTILESGNREFVFITHNADENDIHTVGYNKCSADKNILEGIIQESGNESELKPIALVKNGGVDYTSENFTIGKYYGIKLSKSGYYENYDILAGVSIDNSKLKLLNNELDESNGINIII